ncbi:hypothetical protein GCM10023200_21600 [Actinomycetospora chlora]|uniref:Cupin type-2 domain-containing protein n=1 Tax=Actinomycetospora chlora TaxID=663608 RepID=A0ABP9AXN4_9PSEU
MYYRRVGDVPRKRHTQHRDAAGGLYAEELMGEEGFSSDSSLLYHRGLPSAMVDATPWTPGDLSTTVNQPLLPRHLALHTLFPANEWKAADPVTSRRLVLGNDDVRISYVAAGEASPLYRNAVGDECVFVEAGDAEVETVFGALSVTAGDYLVLPRATTHRWVPSGDGPLRCYVIEANSHVRPPERYLSRFGQFLETAPYCERDLGAPDTPLVVDGAARWRCWSSTATRAGASPARATSCPPTPSTSSAGTAASTPTGSPSPTSSRSPDGCTSPLWCTRSSRRRAS